MRRLLLAALLVMSGCHKQVELSKTLRLAIVDDPASFDPRQVCTLKDLTVLRHMYEGLMRLGREGQIEPAIAERVEISDDQRVYTFHLKESVWSNGDPLTAHDFVRSWKEAVSPEFASCYAYMLAPIEKSEALDEQTLVVTLKAPTPYFLDLCAFPTFSPFHSGGASNGPFTLREWKPGEQISLKKNAHYWDAQGVSLDGIEIAVIPDVQTTTLLFETDQLDWMGPPLSSNLPSEGLEGKASYPVAGTFWLKFNTEAPPFNHPKMRWAFSMAIDRKGIIEHILQGAQGVATGPVPDSMGLKGGAYFEDGNRVVAQRLFEEACHELRITDPKVTLSYASSERNTKIAQEVQHEWEKTFGIPISLDGKENQVYRRNAQAGNFQVGTGDWIADFNDPLAFLEVFKIKNDSNWSNARFNELLERSLTAQEEREGLLLEAESLLVEEMPIAPLYHYSFEYGKKERVSGVVLSPLGPADFRYVNVN